MLGVQVVGRGSPSQSLSASGRARLAGLLRMRSLTSLTHTELLKEGVRLAPLPEFPQKTALLMILVSSPCCCSVSPSCGWARLCSEPCSGGDLMG